MTSLSVAIMAHPKRAKWLPYLEQKLDGRAQVVLDGGWNDRHRTGLEAMRAHDPEATHHLIIQDDALVCRELLPAVEKMLPHAGSDLISLYVGAVRQKHPSSAVTRQMIEASANGTRWIVSDGPRWGPGVVLPVALIADLMEWYSTHPRVKNYDRRIMQWNRQRGGVCRYTVPSLVDHRTIAAHGNRSIANRRRRNRNRRAVRFLGEDGSALSFEWDTL